MKASLIAIAAGVVLLSSGCGREPDSSATPKSENDTAQRDAAPGPLSETQPPSESEAEK